MKSDIIKGLGIVLIGTALMACGRRPEQTADNSAPSLQISKNQAETTTAISTTAVPESSTSTTQTVTSIGQKNEENRNANALAKTAIAEIERRKNVVLGEKYDILIQAQTADMIELQIRHEERSATSIYGTFRYHAKDKTLEEMDSVTGDFKPVR